MKTSVVPVQFEIEGAPFRSAGRVGGPVRSTSKTTVFHSRRRASAAGARSRFRPTLTRPTTIFISSSINPPPRRAAIVADEAASRPAAAIGRRHRARAGVAMFGRSGRPAEQLRGRSMGLNRAGFLAVAAADGRLRRELLAIIGGPRRSGRFFPPAKPGANRVFGVRWTDWVERRGPRPVETWRGDEDLLAHTLSGAALPVGQLEIRSYCRLTGDFTPLATLRGGAPLVARVPTERGGAYFLDHHARAGAIRRWPRAASCCMSSCSGPWPPARPAGQNAATRRRRTAAGDTRRLAAWIAATDRVSRPKSRFIAAFIAAGDELLAVNRPAAEEHGPASWASDAWPNCSRPRFRPRRRQPATWHRWSRRSGVRSWRRCSWHCWPRRSFACPSDRVLAGGAA